MSGPCHRRVSVKSQLVLLLCVLPQARCDQAAPDRQFRRDQMTAAPHDDIVRGSPTIRTKPMSPSVVAIFEGFAVNMKAGAALCRQGKRTVVIDGMGKWPGDALGRWVRVKGSLLQVQCTLPKHKCDERGTVTWTDAAPSEPGDLLNPKWWELVRHTTEKDVREGIAANVRLGASVNLGGDRAVLLDGVAGWRADELGRLVRVKGTLVTRHFRLAPYKYDGDGNVIWAASGVRGPVQYLLDPKWQFVDTVGP